MEEVYEINNRELSRLSRLLDDHLHPRPIAQPSDAALKFRYHVNSTEFDQLKAHVTANSQNYWDLKERVDKMDPPKPIPRFEIVKTEDGTWNLIEYADKHQKLIGVYDTKPEAKQRVSEILSFRKNPDKDNEVIVP